VQTAYEPAKSSIAINAEIVTLTQTGLNMLQRPQQAIVDLLGIQQK
jgi:hypothetical protein